jgi:excinuclease ABC subunit A
MKIEIVGAKENNLKNIDITIPLNKLVVFTGVSGSGKSSLAFDTIHKEGQRRYLETFSSYARNFIGNFERPEVDYINGLSPVISIEQKPVSKNPRSTVGTITETYDYLRLLYSKISTPFSFKTKEKMEKQTLNNICQTILKDYNQKNIILLSPIIKGRKGHYSELFQSLIKKGYTQVQINNQIVKLKPDIKLDRYKTHDINILIDKLQVQKKIEKRLKNSITIALEESKGSLIIKDIKKDAFKYFSQNLTCPTTGISYEKPEPNSFSFNSPKGCCKQCKGLGKIEKIDIEKIIPNRELSIENGGIKAIGEYKSNWIFQQIEIIGRKYNFSLKTPINKISQSTLELILYGIKEKFKVKNKIIGVTQKYDIDFDGIVNFLEEQHKSSNSKKITKWTQQFFTKKICDSCKGNKLKKESLHFLIQQKNISEICEYDIFELKKWCELVLRTTTKTKLIIANEVIKELLNRLNFLINIGLGYLTLSRRTDSLSGGESQRIKIASQIGSELTNILYILDEPSIGLHPVDNKLLIESLKKLNKLGNSIIVVEHDKSMITSADHIVDIGPGAGEKGGEIIFQGTYNKLKKSQSLTSKYLFNKTIFKPKKTERSGNGNHIILTGAKGNNLQNINIKIPLGKLILITGVSGSGKSTLINGTLYPVISNKLHKSNKKAYHYEDINGLEYIDKIINIDQKAIGRSPRSNPITYIGVFTEIRELYANLKESKIRGYKSGRFSFNVKKGSCEECEGNGNTIIQMKLLADIEVPCKTCLGKRFNPETLEIKYNKKNINDILEMSVDEAVVFFENFSKIKNKLKALKDVGMGYIKLGQSSTKLSGGEAQRVKLAAELSKTSTGNTLYILDEPTTGLHFHDINILMNAINRLVDKGNTVIIIEHNTDVIKQADYIIDLGPSGGKKGGEVIFEGELRNILNNKISQTGFFLKKEISSQNE